MEQEGMAELGPFRLLDLPPEIILSIIHHITHDRTSSSSRYCHFAPPPSHLLSLSLTSHYFHSLLRPLVWESVSYVPVTGTVATKEFALKRGLGNLLRLAEGSDGGLPIRKLSINFKSRDRDIALLGPEQYLEERSCVATLIEKLKGSLEILWISGLSTAFFHARRIEERDFGNAMIKAVGKCEILKCLRLNQVGWEVEADVLQEVGQLKALKSLQIMHGHKSLLGLVPCCPSLSVLLLWPESRNIKLDLTEHILFILPQLRYLSLDVVRDPSILSKIGDKLQEYNDSRTPCSLEELFVEGHLSSPSLSRLLDALATVSSSLRRLALYHIRDVTPALIHDIVVACPKLEGLTLVQGDTSQPSVWRFPLDEYLTQLRKFPSLCLFAFDRFAPGSSSQAEYKELQYEVITSLARALPGLRKATVLVQDVSEGATGYFGRIMKEDDGKMRLKMRRKIEKDFLIGHWSDV